MNPPSVEEQMIWAMALQVQPRDVIVVGVATPMAVAAALVAREMLTPKVTIITAATIDPPLHDIATPMVKPETLDRIGVGTLTQIEILDQIQRGRIDLQFISPAQVDRMGRLNTSRVPDRTGGMRRLPGGLATGDVAVLIGRLVAYRADHSPRFLPHEVSYVTGAGHERDPAWRGERALPGKGVMSIVTDRAVLEWRDQAFAVLSHHGEGELSEVTEGCGFDLVVEEPVPVTPPPPGEALDLLRTKIDPHGLRRLEVRATRADALAALEELQT